MIFDDVEQKNWRDYNGQDDPDEEVYKGNFTVHNSNIDASIVLTFMNEFFNPPEEGEEPEPLDVRILFAAQQQRKNDILEAAQQDVEAKFNAMIEKMRPADRKTKKTVMTEE